MVTTTLPMDDNHYKILCITKRDMLLIINGEAYLTNIPSDSIISGVIFEFRTNCFEIMLHHHSFPEVPVGMMPTVFSATIEKTGKSTYYKRKITL